MLPHVPYPSETYYIHVDYIPHLYDRIIPLLLTNNSRHPNTSLNVLNLESKDMVYLWFCICYWRSNCFNCHLSSTNPWVWLPSSFKPLSGAKEPNDEDCTDLQLFLTCILNGRYPISDFFTACSSYVCNLVPTGDLSRIKVLKHQYHDKEK